MKQENDILKDRLELKQMPYTVPEGYFESFKAQAAKPMVRKIDFRARIAPYAAMAAVFIFMVTAGTFFLEKSVPEYQMTEEDYVMFSDNFMNAIAYEMEYGSALAEAELSEEDIINYLIYTGVTAEQIEFSK
jgi:hypothetical protein